MVVQWFGLVFFGGTITFYWWFQLDDEPNLSIKKWLLNQTSMEKTGGLKFQDGGVLQQNHIPGTLKTQFQMDIEVISNHFPHGNPTVFFVGKKTHPTG